MTRDENFELVIADYQSADVDIESQLKASSLPRCTPTLPLPPSLAVLCVCVCVCVCGRWKVISLSGSFSRSGGLQAGLDYVTVSEGLVCMVWQLVLFSGPQQYCDDGGHAPHPPSWLGGVHSQSKTHTYTYSGSYTHTLSLSLSLSLSACGAGDDGVCSNVLSPQSRLH